jgi:hypothetical protein
MKDSTHFVSMDDVIGHLDLCGKITICIVLTTLEFGVEGAGNKQLSGYKFPVTSVSACPQDSSSWKLASNRRNCTQDSSMKNRYICVPNEKQTRLLEFCYDQIRPLVQKGLKMQNKLKVNLFIFFSGMTN